MTHIFRLVLLISVAALAAGCAAPRIQTRTSVFHNLPATLPAESKIAILPWKAADAASLEYQAYAEQVRGWLQKKGVGVAREGEPGTLALFLDYGIDDGRQVVSSYSVPQWGVTGYTAARTTGTVNTYGNTSFINATTTAQPTYGVTGYNQVTRSTQVFRRFVNIDIVQPRHGESPRKVYEARLQSEGTCGTLAAVMPAFLQAIFTEFPGEPGSARRADLPWDGKC